MNVPSRTIDEVVEWLEKQIELTDNYLPICFEKSNDPRELRKLISTTSLMERDATRKLVLVQALNFINGGE